MESNLVVSVPLFEAAGQRKKQKTGVIGGEAAAPPPAPPFSRGRFKEEGANDDTELNGAIGAEVKSIKRPQFPSRKTKQNKKRKAAPR